MPVPKRRTSRSKRDKRRSHNALSVPNLVECPHCLEKTMPHRICKCGYYKGRQYEGIEVSEK